MPLSRLRRPGRDCRCAVVVVVVVILHLTLSSGGTHQGAAGGVAATERKVEQESDEDRESSGPMESVPSGEVVYDQRQVNGETNIRLNIKNFQLRLPESQLEHFHKSDMARLIRNSVLQLFGLSAMVANSGAGAVPSNGSSPNPPHQQQQQPHQTTGNSPPQHEQQQLSDGAASMLQVNGNNLPAKFFLEISDFLMNTNDNDAVDDKRVETNHNQQQQQQMQQQHLRQPSPQLVETPLYAMEEITIERVENSNNVKNETITISKRIKHVGPVPPNGTALETVSTENRFTSNATRNATENENRFMQTKPIRLDTLMVPPKTFREKVIWRMPKDEGDADD